MDKNLFIKYFRGEASEPEIDRILEWVHRSSDNKNYFAHAKAIWDLSGEVLQPLPMTKNSIGNKNKNLFWLLYLSVAAVVIVLLSLNLFLRHQIAPLNEEGLPMKNIVDNMVTIYTNKGVKGSVVLPDSTVVWMNSDSKISYPVNFAHARRDVSMSGEIYFEVKKDSLCPMYVTTNKNLTVEVLGTSFSIKSYNNDSESKTTLFNGSIVLHYKDSKTLDDIKVNIKPSEMITCIDSNIKPILSRPKDITRVIAWKDGKLLFDNTPMSEAIKMLERWYGATFVVKNQDIYKYKLTSTFHSESITQVLDMMKYCMPMQFVVKENVITIN